MYSKSIRLQIQIFIQGGQKNLLSESYCSQTFAVQSTLKVSSTNSNLYRWYYLQTSNFLLTLTQQHRDNLQTAVILGNIRRGYKLHNLIFTNVRLYVLNWRKS